MIKLKPNALINNRKILLRLCFQRYNSTSTTNLQNIKPNQLNKKFNDVYRFYEEISGMDVVRLAQDKVIAIQDQLQLAQEKRRELINELSVIRKDLQGIHTEIMNCGKGEHRYLELIKQEIDIIRRERETLEIFQVCDTKERELFTYLTSAVKMSHEKERFQANTVKYWSIIGSVVGALLGIIGSGLSYRYRSKQFEQIISQSDSTIAHLQDLNNSMNALNQSLLGIQKLVEPNKDQESWFGYFKRKYFDCQRYFIPAK